MKWVTGVLRFQTGFDEPMLHTMYVDKKLGGVNAVQTLSRPNRTMRGKAGVLILDFVNEIEDIQTAFQDYYQTIFLEEETDPDKLHDLQTEMDGYALYTEPEVDAFPEIFFHPIEPMEKLQPILDAVVGRWKALPDPNDHYYSPYYSPGAPQDGFVATLRLIPEIMDWYHTRFMLI